MTAGHRRFVAAIPALALFAACVSPSRTYDDYEHKAANTAEAAVGAVETARAAVEAAGRGNTFSPYLAVIVAEAEKDAGAAQATFDSVQPPDDSADDLREKLDQLLQDATDALSALRVAVRRRDRVGISEQTSALATASKALDDFEKAHS